jgi:hypothetical protein
LHREIDRHRQTDTFSAGEIAELAHEVLEREIRSATDPEGETLLAELADCAAAVATPLAHRAERADETAGIAELVLVESGRSLPAKRWTLAATAERGALRAAAARDTRDESRWSMREQLLNDRDARVRRAALKSCSEAPSPIHRETLVGLLRRDPEPECRQLAAKALGVLGGPGATTSLIDAWARAEEAVRLAIVAALAQQRTFEDGGRQRLAAIARGEAGSVGVVAAVSLAKGQSDARWHGQARITRALEFGSAEDQRIALAAADWTLSEHSRLLVKLGLKAPTETRVWALGRWLEQPAHRWAASTQLLELASGTDTTAIAARSVLAQYGERAVRPSLNAQLGYARAESRLQAARDLWLLRDLNGVARALGDDAPSVRVGAACLALAPSAPR